MMDIPTHSLQLWTLNQSLFQTIGFFLLIGRHPLLERLMDFEFLLYSLQRNRIQSTGNRPLFISRAPFNDSHWRIAVPAMLHQFFTDKRHITYSHIKGDGIDALSQCLPIQVILPLVITAMACHNRIT